MPAHIHKHPPPTFLINTCKFHIYTPQTTPVPTRPTSKNTPDIYTPISHSHPHIRSTHSHIYTDVSVPLFIYSYTHTCTPPTLGRRPTSAPHVSGTPIHLYTRPLWYTYLNGPHDPLTQMYTPRTSTLTPRSTHMKYPHSLFSGRRTSTYRPTYTFVYFHLSTHRYLT